MKKPPNLKNDNIKNARLLVNRVKQLELLPQNGIVAEIGVQDGNYSELILKYNNPSKLYLIEIDTNYSEKLKVKFAEQIKTGSVVVINESSFIAHSNFPNDYFDWIYIDAAHDYESVLRDSKNFWNEDQTCWIYGSQ